MGGVIDGQGWSGGQLLMTDAHYGDFRIIVSSNMVVTGGSSHLGICFWGGRTPIGHYNNCKLILPPGGTDGNNVCIWDYSLGGGLNSTITIGTLTYNANWNITGIGCFLAKGFCRVALNGTAVATCQEAKLSSIQSGPIGLQIHNGTNEEVQNKDVFVDPAPTVHALLTVKWGRKPPMGHVLRRPHRGPVGKRRRNAARLCTPLGSDRRAKGSASFDGYCSPDFAMHLDRCAACHRERLRS